VTENGWTDDFVSPEWLRNTFIPQARRKTPDKTEKIVLILDGHGSHVTAQFVADAKEANVEVFCLPPHTTHKLQPLDVGCFGPMKKRWMEHCEDTIERTGDPIEKSAFVREYLRIRRDAMTENIVRSSFRKSGISPLNGDVFGDDDYAPSNTSSTHSHFPASFPGTQSIPVPDATKSTADLDSEPDEDATESGVDLRDRTDGVGALVNGAMQAANGKGGSASASVADAASEADVGRADNRADASGLGAGSVSDNAMEVDPPYDWSVWEDPNGAPVDAPTNEDGVPTPARAPSPPASLEVEHVPHLTPARERPSFQRTPIPPKSGWKDKYETTDMDLLTLQSQFSDLARRLDTAQTHCVLAQQENNRLRYQLHGKAEKAKAPTTEKFKAIGLMTAPKAMAALAAQKEAKDAKAREEHEKKERLVVKERDAEKRRRDLLISSTTAFTGTLASKSKDNLKDIAYVLGLTLEPKATNPQIAKQVESALRADPVLQADIRFAGIWGSLNGKRGRRAAAHADANGAHYRLLFSVYLTIFCRSQPC
jgi:hypothetical protein